MTGWFLTLCMVVSVLGSFEVAAAEEERETFLSDFRLKDGTYRPLGFKVHKIGKGTVYEKIGLMSGDIIKKLNKRPISNSSEAKDVFAQLKTLKSIDLVVLRNGQEVPLRYRR